MKLFKCIQGSEEWHRLRAGVITCSNFSMIRQRLKSGKNKGKFTQAAADYGFKLAIERFSGSWLEEDGFNGWQAERGQKLEAKARELHEIERGVLVEQVGFATTDCGKFGASVDGFVDLYGIAEYKCFLAPSKLRPILLEGSTACVMDQIQGGLWITGRDYGEFVLYCPALESRGKHLKIIGIERDDDYIAAMVEDLYAFDRLVCEEMQLLERAA